MTTVIGYVRVSTSDQNVENQKKQIADAGYSVTRWFSDEAVSGAIKAGERPGFAELLNYVREGDTLIVIAIDRLGRNTIDVLSMAGLASLEKDLIAERRAAGIKRAQSEGKHCGRPIKATVEQVRELLARGLPPAAVQDRLEISKATFYRLKSFLQLPDI